MKYYLAYGMNSNLYGMEQRCPKARSLGKVTLPNHKLAFRTFCDVVEVPGETMECALWSITDECEKSLDRLEGYPNFYGKKEVKVNHDGRIIRAMIYYMKDLHEHRWPSRHYLDMVIEGYEDHDISLYQITDALGELDCILS